MFKTSTFILLLLSLINIHTSFIFNILKFIWIKYLSSQIYLKIIAHRCVLKIINIIYFNKYFCTCFYNMLLFIYIAILLSWTKKRRKIKNFGLKRNYLITSIKLVLRIYTLISIFIICIQGWVMLQGN